MQDLVIWSRFDPNVASLFGLLMLFYRISHVNGNASRASLQTECFSSSGHQRFFFQIADKGGREPRGHLPYLVMQNLAMVDERTKALGDYALAWYVISLQSGEGVFVQTT